MPNLSIITDTLDRITSNTEGLKQQYQSQSTRNWATKSALNKAMADLPYISLATVQEALHLITPPSSQRDIGISDPNAQMTRAFRTPNIDPTGFLGTISKLDDVFKFGDEAAKLTKADDITKLARERFPSISDETATALGRKFENVTDAKAIADDLSRTVSKSPVERGFTKSVREEIPLAPIKPTRYIPRSTDALAIAAKNFIRENPSGAERLATTGTSDEAIATASELIKKLSDDASRAGDRLQQEALYDKLADVASATAKNLTELGRSVQAATILSKQTPEGIVRFAARTIQKYNDTVPAVRRIPELTGKVAEDFANEMRRIQGMAEGRDKAMALQKLYDRIADLIPVPWWKKFITAWKAGLLTGLKTSGLNILSNLSHSITEIAKDIPAVAVDSVAALFTGKRTVAFTTGKGRGIKEGFEKGWDYLKTGFDERDVAKKLDYKRISFGTSPFAKAIQRYEETIFRFIGSQDQVFYYGAKARSIMGQALAQAKNAGLRGKERQAFIDDFISNPPDEALKYAALDAEVSVFQNSTGLGRAARAFQNIGGGIGEFIVPFGRTPSAVATQVLNYSPFGVAKTLIEAVIKRKEFDQRLFSQALGRGLTGTGIMYVGTELYRQGLINLDYPQSEKERNQWKLEGKIPNSIKVGDQYRSAAVLGPAGLTLILGGHFERALKQTGSPTQAIVTAAAGIGKSLTEQTFLKGMSQFLEAIANPADSFSGWFTGILGSIIPTIVADIARASDKYERRSEGLLGRFQSRIPGLRQTLEPQINALGQKVETAHPLEVMLDPTRPSDVSSDPVVLELKRLWEEGEQPTPTQLGNRTGYDVLSPEDNTHLWERHGDILRQKLDALIKTEPYAKLSDEDKAKKILDFAEKAGHHARAEIALLLTQGLSGEALREKLSELKKAKILTEDVYKIYRRKR